MGFRALALMAVAGIVVGVLAWMGLKPEAAQLTEATRTEAKLTEAERQELEAEETRCADEINRLSNEGKSQEVVAAAPRMLAALRRLHGENSQALANWLEWFAWHYERIEDFDSAEAARAEALRNKAARLPADHWEVTDARLALDHSRLLRGLTTEQRAKLREADELRDRLATLYHQYKYAECIEVAEKSLAIRKSILGGDHCDVALAVNFLANACMKAGDTARAESLFGEGLETRKKCLGETHPACAENLCGLANISEARGDYTRAESRSREALEIRRAALGEMHADYAANLNRLGNLFLKMGDYPRAEQIYRRTLEIRKTTLGEAHSDYAESLHKLGKLYAAMGEDTRAESLFREAAEIWKKADGESHPNFAIGLHSIAVALLKRGMEAESERHCVRAMEILEATVGELDPTYIECLVLLAYRERLKGNFPRTEALYLRALESWRKTGAARQTNYAATLTQLADLCKLREQHGRAVEMCREILAISRENLEQAANVQSQRQQLAMLANVRDRLDALITIAIEAPQYREIVFAEVLSWKGLVLARQRAIRAAGDQPELAGLLEEMRKTTSELAALSIAKPASAQSGDWETRIRALSTKKESLEAKLAAASKEFRKTQAPITVASLQAALTDDTALVDLLEFTFTERPGEDQLARTEKRLAAFVVRSSGEIALCDLGPVDSLEEAIANWRSDDGRSTRSRQAAHLLRKRIWLPVEKFLAGATTVLVSPDGELSKIPLAALPGKSVGSYLLEEYALALVPAPQAIVEFERSESAVKPDGEMLVLADVNYERRSAAKLAKPGKRVALRAARDSADEAFGPLPGTRGELESIQKLHRGTFGAEGIKALQGGEASEDAFVGEAPRHTYLHIATHGYFAAERFKSALARSAHEPVTPGREMVSNQSLAGYHPGLLSGLALAGANRPTAEDDGILTSEEVGSLNLGGVDLVVLSACETGLGEVAGGEGLLGLQRAFQGAGARTVIASLWNVDDVATRDLMERFYDNLWNKKMTKVAALREAQLWMLTMRGPRGLKQIEPELPPGAGASRPAVKRLSPHYWAAFVLSGDWR